MAVVSSAELESALLQRFGASIASAEFSPLSHTRLMEESERRLSDVVLRGEPAEALVASRILDNARDYSLWEDEHAALMRRIAAQRISTAQKSELLNVSLALIHRKALFEYLRDRRVRGQARRTLMAHFFRHRDYHCSVVAEHGQYLRSAASYLCSSHVGGRVMFDALFGAPLAEYEDVYASYFRAYCDRIFTGDDDPIADSMLPLLMEMKAQVGEWRNALTALTQSQSGVWRRPRFRSR